jgi:uncharacterized membrane protein
MSSILISLSTLLHALATVILIGHFLLLALVYLPVLATNDLSILSEISKRSRTWLYVSLVIFFITGAYLTLVDSNYLGLGNFSNAWAMLMLVKHVLILGMLGIGFWFNAILRVGPLLSSNTGAAAALGRFRSYVNWMAILGFLVLLLTAIAQIES